MCKTYDAIYELAEHVESDILICFLGHFKVEGVLHKCEDNKKGKCFKDVVTLENAKVFCPEHNYEKEYAWLNVPTHHIQTFAFKCCER